MSERTDSSLPLIFIAWVLVVIAVEIPVLAAVMYRLVQLIEAVQ